MGRGKRLTLRKRVRLMVDAPTVIAIVALIRLIIILIEKFDDKEK
jgi:hypothetical protein